MFYFPQHIIDKINNYKGNTDFCVNKNYGDLIEEFKSLSNNNFIANLATLRTLDEFINWKFLLVCGKDIYKNNQYYTGFNLVEFIYRNEYNLNSYNYDTTGWRSPIDIDLLVTLNNYYNEV